MQTPKIIDVTRSFIPIDPNAYPETLHSTDGEDKPERRTPVVPYIGYNFLPTSYGYKSFFGTNAKLLINTLAPAKPQHIFIFQSTTYKNFIVALCDTGIWVKDSFTTGAWVNPIALAAPGAGVYSEWTFTTINNKLYCFRSNAANFYEIATDGSSLGAAITTKTPSFITIASQLGLFRLGSRLAFWDGTNAIAWCNPDNFEDFTPAVLTGANVTTFRSVIGKISSIRSHGKDAIVYATKSIVLLEIQAAETFFVKTRPVISGEIGVAYMAQSVAAVPDTLHFAYTDTSIYKIQNTQPEVIVPEVYDHFKDYTNVPVYLELLQGRYLCFEILDENLINGKAQFTNEVIPGATVDFPGSVPGSFTEVAALDPAYANICDIAALATENFYDEQQADGDTAVPPASRRGLPQPLYTAYLSLANGPVNPIVWGAAPCGSSPHITPSPSTNAGKLSLWSTTSSNKTAKAGSDVYSDGKWTIQRFVQYQSAIWESQQRELVSYVAEIVNRQQTHVAVTADSSCPAVAGVTSANCTIGRYPTEYSNPQFGFNQCSFWLTRWATAAIDIVNTVVTTITCELQEELSLWRVAGHDWGTVTTTGYVYTTAQAAADAAAASYDAVFPGGGRGAYILSAPTSSTPGGNALSHTMTASNGGGVVPGTIERTLISSNYWKTTSRVSTNAAVPVVGFGPIPETGYCLLSHWKYVDLNNVTQTVAATACVLAVDFYPGDGTSQGQRAVPQTPAREDLLGTDGSFCGIPYEHGIDDDQVNWESQSIEYPATGFLLQRGSIAPVYPTKYGAFVYDLHLKKWGKYKEQYKCLLDYSPINGSEGSVVDFNTFGILAGVHKIDGFIYIFDNDPSKSLLTWGKIGYYRAGMTDCQEVRFDFASISAGTVKIDVSMDGTSVATDLAFTETFNGKTHTTFPPYSGKWFNISLTGNWDVSHIEFNGLRKGRR